MLVNEATVDDLDAEAVAKAREKFVEAHPSLAKEVPRWSVMTLMEKLFLAKKGRLTRAALILLGKPESVVLLSPAVATHHSLRLFLLLYMSFTHPHSNAPPPAKCRRRSLY